MRPSNATLNRIHPAAASLLVQSDALFRLAERATADYTRVPQNDRIERRISQLLSEAYALTRRAGFCIMQGLAAHDGLTQEQRDQAREYAQALIKAGWE